MIAIDRQIAPVPALLGQNSAHPEATSVVQDPGSYPLPEPVSTPGPQSVALSRFTPATWNALLELQAAPSSHDELSRAANEAWEVEADIAEPEEDGEASDQEIEAEASDGAVADNTPQALPSSDEADGAVEGPTDGDDQAAKGLEPFAEDEPTASRPR
ncbi:hypothetical protein [Phenylobacterium aquaticum]|uniref:hypothetical protein n=1 Tax=Phenylobacterium aquaticum TaxID=1763816 RepID=UPI001F5DF3B7|nr:hypothetical protein [Phenylobacterium aquaticum]MCI3132719.1 hypothetical protein [Phenylobacterium aquaticum]